MTTLGPAQGPGSTEVSHVRLPHLPSPVAGACFSLPAVRSCPVPLALPGPAACQGSALPCRPGTGTPAGTLWPGGGGNPNRPLRPLLAAHRGRDREAGRCPTRVPGPRHQRGTARPVRSAPAPFPEGGVLVG